MADVATCYYTSIRYDTRFLSSRKASRAIRTLVLTNGVAHQLLWELKLYLCFFLKLRLSEEQLKGSHTKMILYNKKVCLDDYNF